MSDLRRGLVEEQLHQARTARATLPGRPDLGSLSRADRNRCLHAMDLVEQSFDRLIALDDPQGLAWIALRCEFLSTTEDGLSRKRDEPASIARHVRLEEEHLEVLRQLIVWRQRWDALEVPQKKEEEVLTLIAHASDSARLMKALLKERQRDLKRAEKQDPADMDLGRVDNVQERRELKKALVTQVENEVDAVQAVLDYIKASLVDAKCLICETRYKETQPAPYPARAPQPSPTPRPQELQHAGRARRPTLVPASVEDGRGEGERWRGLRNLFKKGRGSSASDRRERELACGWSGGEVREGAYRLRRRYFGEVY